MRGFVTTIALAVLCTGPAWVAGWGGLLLVALLMGGVREANVWDVLVQVGAVPAAALGFVASCRFLLHRRIGPLWIVGLVAVGFALTPFLRWVVRSPMTGEAGELTVMLVLVALGVASLAVSQPTPPRPRGAAATLLPAKESLG